MARLTCRGQRSCRSCRRGRGVSDRLPLYCATGPVTSGSPVCPVPMRTAHFPRPVTTPGPRPFAGAATAAELSLSQCPASRSGAQPRRCGRLSPHVSSIPMRRWYPDTSRRRWTRRVRSAGVSGPPPGSRWPAVCGSCRSGSRAARHSAGRLAAAGGAAARGTSGTPSPPPGAVIDSRASPPATRRGQVREQRLTQPSRGDPAPGGSGAAHVLQPTREERAPGTREHGTRCASATADRQASFQLPAGTVRHTD